jgi:hypothetical protein
MIWCAMGLPIAFAVGCSLLVDASDVDHGCPAGTKLCDVKCVAIGDPAYGCDPVRCDPCRIANAIPTCRDQTCVVDNCLLGFGCPGSTGCEANVFIDPKNCGECHQACASAEICREGQCSAAP